MDDKDKRIKRLEELLESSNNLSFQRAKRIQELEQENKALFNSIKTHFEKEEVVDEKKELAETIFTNILEHPGKELCYDDFAYFRLLYTMKDAAKMYLTGENLTEEEFDEMHPEQAE